MEKGISNRTQHEAIISYGDGNGITLFEQQYAVTDFPLDELRLFFVDDTLMLPNEYKANRYANTTQ